jgi:hypothetical protein
MAAELYTSLARWQAELHPEVDRAVLDEMHEVSRRLIDTSEVDEFLEEMSCDPAKSSLTSPAAAKSWSSTNAIRSLWTAIRFAFSKSWTMASRLKRTTMRNG